MAGQEENLIEKLSEERAEAKSVYLASMKSRDYYDVNRDKEIQGSYYRDVAFDRDSLHTLLEKTHQKQLDYSPHRYVYPWVDLQENGKLKSLYSGKGMDPIEVIEEDIRMLERGAAGALAEITLNCEHVVPQSWFDRKNPMRGDLHHLFACEPTCNSSRGNSPYYDFKDYTPEAGVSGIKEGCGKSEDEKFEPEYGKGIVARATLYFLIRYQGTINSSKADQQLLLEWHQKFPVSVYEKHRNLAIYELQGNRNPFIDFPERAGELSK
ncbi:MULTISPECIES: endonuclease I family protein [Bacillus]|uniref:Endonuclease I n=2 Tax=Bacillus TaxID=1386 RepID=A0A0M4GB60_9BACI|nr:MULTISPECIES: endonuclease [Bacillus]ALC82890.1 endonuclease I [Bacillus gobiensis]MBP1081865.1 endonuclease I [Bacillus capparidis]MED1096514.1 endonuclease [Bacillus capparidis]